MKFLSFIFALILTSNSLFASYPGETPSYTSVDGGNLRLSANTLSSVNTNGNILLTPDGTGRIGIGASSPVSKVHVSGTDAASSKVLTQRTSNDGAGAVFTVAKARTASYPLSGDVLGGIAARAIDGSGVGAAVETNMIILQATENQSATAAGRSISFYTSANTTTSVVERMKIGQDGVVTIANLTPSLPVKTDASSNLVSGAISLTSEVSGILPIANGGTGASTLAGADIVTKTGSLVDECVPTFDGTTGPIQCNSPARLSNAGALTGLTQVDGGNLRLSANLLSSTDTNGDITITPNGTGSISMSAAASGMILPNISQANMLTLTSTSGRFIYNTDRRKPMYRNTTDARWLSVTDVNYLTSTVDTVASDRFDVYRMSASGGNRSLTLPTASDYPGRVITVRRTDGSGNTLTVVGTINGSSDLSMPTQYMSRTFMSNGTDWDIIGGYL